MRTAPRPGSGAAGTADRAPWRHRSRPRRCRGTPGRGPCRRRCELAYRVDGVGPAVLGEVVAGAAGNDDQGDIVLGCHSRDGTERSVSPRRDQHLGTVVGCFPRQGTSFVTRVHLTDIDLPVLRGPTDTGLVGTRTCRRVKDHGDGCIAHRRGLPFTWRIAHYIQRPTYSMQPLRNGSVNAGRVPRERGPAERPGPGGGNEAVLIAMYTEMSRRPPPLDRSSTSCVP